MEGDVCDISVSDLRGVISIHSLRMEGDKRRERVCAVEIW